MAELPHFDKALLSFLGGLKKNNDREWFQKNKKRYESDLKEPAVRFISDFAAPLAKISTHFRADPRTVGGSLFRIYKDTRFSKDKTPYKTHMGLHFRHDLAKNVHAPGFYLHVEAREAFVGAGIWHPESAPLRQIREAIVEDPAGWKKVVGSKRFKAHYALSGESLKRPPTGFDADHPLIGDLKRKDFIAVTSFPAARVTEVGFLEDFAGLCADAKAFVRFLCEAVGVPF